MTDEQIIKASEYCSTDVRQNTCPKCAFYKKHRCSTLMLNAVSDLINRQQTKIEALQTDNKQLQSDVINANQNWEHIKGLWEREKEKVEIAKQKVIYACKMLKAAKSEAIKEFAEKLKKRFYLSAGRCVVDVYHIDNLVKEITEADK